MLVLRIYFDLRFFLTKLIRLILKLGFMCYEVNAKITFFKCLVSVEDPKNEKNLILVV